MRVTTTSPDREVVPQPVRSATVEIVVPVYNEERALPGCIRTLRAYLAEHFPVPWRITVVNNASTDATASVAAELVERYTGVGVLNLEALFPLVAPLLTGHSDIAIGSRLAPGRGSCAAPNGSSSPGATTR